MLTKCKKMNNNRSNKKRKKTTTIIKDTNNNSKKTTKLTKRKKREIINRHRQHIAPASVHGQARTSCTEKIEEVLITISKHLMRNTKYIPNINRLHPLHLSNLHLVFKTHLNLSTP